MADDRKQQPAGPSEGDPRVAAKVKPAKQEGGASHGATSGGSTSTAPAGGRSR
jgi:hypothetical protein